MTTNREWLYSLDVADLADWFDAEHVETKERALDGDTEPENEDSRERLEAEIESYSAFDMMDTITLDMVIGWLDRQAAITEREYGERMASEAMCSNVCAVVCEQRGRIAELQAQVYELTAEREQYRKLFGMAPDWAHEITMLESSIDEGMA